MIQNKMIEKALQRHFALDNKAEDVNKLNFCSYMEEQNKLGNLQIVTLPDKMIYRLHNNAIDVSLSSDTGLYLYTDAGHGKSNRRQYISINGWMCPAYVFRVVFEGLTSDIPQHIERYQKYNHGIYEYRELTKEEKIYDGCDTKSKIYAPTFSRSVINHINGDTMDNSDDNLEVVSYSDNNKHSRFMSEVCYYYPDLFIVEYDCQQHAMHRWVDKVGITCSQINTYNKHANETKRPVIKSYKNKKDTFESHYTKDEVDYMLRFFNKLNKTTPETVIKHSISSLNNDVIEYDF